MSIDPAALSPYRDVMGPDADSFIVDLIDTFLSTTQELVVALYTSISTGDSKLFTRSAHTLKSNSAVFGAQLLAGLCLELESAGKNADLVTLLTKVDQVKTEYEQVCHELVSLRQGLVSL